MSSGRRRSAFVLLLLAVLVNLPFVHSTWTDAKVERSGADVTATVVDHREPDWLSFRFPAEIDPDQRTWSVEVEEPTYDEAVGTGRLEVRVLEDDPSAYRVDGALESRVPLVATVVADVVLLLLALLMWRFGGRLRSSLRAVALGDVERCPPETLLERLQAEDYLVRGEVLEVGPDRVVLDLGNRTIEVLLDGHHNAVGHQQAAQVKARMIG
ncbi:MULTISPECIES: hypothetical protein [unclassified Nocardioides]|uniref:hypothetical protein n=1 Tax=unclassified Nocardioides TaxID=2615069 RepID=UPI000056FEB0|nr:MULTISPECIES: hypothetical protein [unclassified Nocardioides]ABL79655.1 hypothetical protein Noca_0110 [Nocardioides sp. JS614]